MRLVGQLVHLTRLLGQPRQDYVILSEGNTSVRVDEESFWVKTSGSRMADVGRDDFVQVRTDEVLALLEEKPLSEREMRSGLDAARVVPSGTGSPSIETAMHALCLTLGEATFVGHTHPTAINAILCARHAERPFGAPIFPAEALVCGEPLFVPYAPPGHALALAVQQALRTRLAAGGEPPRALLLQNHGLVALGDTPQDVQDITEMMVKTAQILVQTYALSGPRFVDNRPG